MPINLEETSLGHNGKFTSAWSRLNIVAYAVEKTEKGCVVQYLNIFNPNLCWDVFSEHYSYGPISCMEWNHSGEKLIVGDLKGNCSVWTMKDHMSNVWECEEKSLNQILLGEEILSIGWLHSGYHIPFKNDTLDSLAKKFQPSLRRFGNKPVTGYLAVTSTGRVAFRICDCTNEQVIICQLNVSGHQQLADIAFTKEGTIKVVMSNGKINHFIRTFDVRLKFDHQNKVVADVTSSGGMTLECSKEKDCPYTFISHVKFITREVHDHLLICVSGPNISRFESWLLRQREVNLNRIFQSLPVKYVLEMKLDWKFATASSQLTSRVRNFSVPSLAINAGSTEIKLAESTNFWCGRCIAVAYADNTIELLHRVYLNQLASRSVLHKDAGAEARDCPPNAKRAKTQAIVIQQVLFSPMSCALLAFEGNGGALLFSVPPWLNRDSGNLTNQNVTKIVKLLHHCLITGFDWWDILLCVKAEMVSSVVEGLDNEILKLNPQFQQVTLSRVNAMKMSIFHLSNSFRSTDIFLGMMLRAISLVFRSLILPQNRITREELDPAQKLENISKTSYEKDVDKMLHNLDADPQTLQSMQQLIQWIADLVLYLIASVPYRNESARPGFALLRDRDFLALLRENLVLIRVWGLLKQACMPLFTKLKDDLDVISHSFELITMLWQTGVEEEEVPRALVSACSVLPMQVLIPDMIPLTSPNSVLYHLSNQPHIKRPFRFVFGTAVPDSKLDKKRAEQQVYVKSMSGQTARVDMLRLVSLGNTTSPIIKQCIRCGVVSLFNTQKRIALQVWEQRFITNCICGGIWRKMTRRDSLLL